MKRTIRMIHPNFIFGLLSYIGLFAGILLNSADVQSGKTVIIASALLGSLHWFGSIIHVSKELLRRADEGIAYFWFVTVLAIPPMGGMFYYMINDKRVAVKH